MVLLGKFVKTSFLGQQKNNACMKKISQRSFCPFDSRFYDVNDGVFFSFSRKYFARACGTRTSLFQVCFSVVVVTMQVFFN